MRVDSQVGLRVDAEEKQVADIADLVLKVTALAERYERVAEQADRAACERLTTLRSTAARGRSALSALARG